MMRKGREAMRRTRLAALVLATLWAGGAAFRAQEPRPPTPLAPPDLAGIHAGRTRVLDLSYAISEKLTAWPGSERAFSAEPTTTLARDGYFSQRFCVLEHYGTHMDAPVHFPPGRTPVDKIPPERLFGPAVVIDVRAQAEANADYRLSAARLQLWEQKHGRIPEGAIVLLRTAWAARFADAARYRNADAQGVMHFPGFSVEAVKLLIERKVSGLGIDTLSVDYGPAKDFEVHRLSHGAGLYHLENLADLSELPENGAWLVVAPVKLAGGSGGPVRVFAILP
jgi:kynurenine formamidase